MKCPSFPGTEGPVSFVYNDLLLTITMTIDIAAPSSMSTSKFLHGCV